MSSEETRSTEEKSTASNSSPNFSRRAMLGITSALGLGIVTGTGTAKSQGNGGPPFYNWREDVDANEHALQQLSALTMAENETPIQDFAGENLSIGSDGVLNSTGGGSQWADTDDDGLLELAESDGINISTIETDRLLTSSRDAEVVVWTDGDTYYADGETTVASGDDPVAVINQALQAASDVFIAPGEYDLTGDYNPIEVPGETCLRGAGEQSSLRTSVDAISIGDVDQVRISNLGIVGDDARVGVNLAANPVQDKIRIDNCVFEGSFRYSSLQINRRSRSLGGATRVQVDGNWVKNNPSSYGLYVGGATGALVTNNIVENTYYNGICIYEGTNHFAVVGNMCRKNGHAPIACSPASEGVIVGNTVDSLNPDSDNPYFEAGIEVESTFAHRGGGQSRRVQILGNHVTGCDAGVVVRNNTQSDETNFDSPADVGIHHNVLENNGVGIALRGDATGIREGENIIVENTDGRFTVDDDVEVVGLPTIRMGTATVSGAGPASDNSFETRTTTSVTVPFEQSFVRPPSVFWSITSGSSDLKLDHELILEETTTDDFQLRIANRSTTDYSSETMDVSWVATSQI